MLDRTMELIRKEAARIGPDTPAGWDLTRGVIHGLHDEARHQGEMYLLLKLCRALRLTMQKHTRPVKSKYLGLIGEEHLRQRLMLMGVEEKSFRYTKKLAKDGLPWILECAFGWKGDGCEDNRSIFAGANWSSAINNPFRSFGSTGEGLEAELSDLKAGAHEPIVYVLHLAHPRVEYTDRGKSALVVRTANQG